MQRTQFGGIGNTLLRGLMFLVVLALLAAVLFLLSDINQRHYRLARHEDTLIVERGRFFPLGYAPYEPDNDALQQAYAPIEVPKGELVDTNIPFDDRSEVDRALYGRLSGWAQDRLGAEDPNTLALGISYVKRLEILPGLSEDQRHALRSMRADAALRQAEGFMQRVTMTLGQARILFEQALELGCAHPERARQGLDDITHKLSQLGETSSATQRDAEAETRHPIAPKQPILHRNAKP